MLLQSLSVGCTTSIPSAELEQVQTIAILNNFPDEPNFMIWGTTIFNNKTSDIPDTDYKKVVLTTFAEKFIQMGYQVFEINDKSLANQFDMLIRLEPLSVGGLPFSNGYGIYQSTLLGVQTFAYSYAGIQAYATRGKKNLCFECFGWSKTEIEIDGVPELWAELEADKQAELLRLLYFDIENAVNMVLEDAGI